MADVSFREESQNLGSLINKTANIVFKNFTV